MHNLTEVKIRRKTLRKVNNHVVAIGEKDSPVIQFELGNNGKNSILIYDLDGHKAEIFPGNSKVVALPPGYAFKGQKIRVKYEARELGDKNKDGNPAGNIHEGFLLETYPVDYINC